MKNVNQLVLNVQALGTEGVDFLELFNIINKETIEPKAKSYILPLKGDLAEAYSQGYELLVTLCEKWNGTGNFHTLYKKSYSNLLINLKTYTGRNVRKHNTSYQISLSEGGVTGDEYSPVLETLYDESLVTYIKEEEETVSLESLIVKFGEVNPEKAGIIEIMVMFTPETPQSEKTRAYCEYFGVQEYTKIQKRISRARESFYKFLKANDYSLSF